MTAENNSSAISFTVQLDPVPLGRPRFSRRGWAYLPQRSRDYRQALQIAAADFMQEHDLRPLRGELTCCFEFYRKFKRGSRNFGDLDNHVKGVLDALTGICYKDDASVVEVFATKDTDKLNPRTQIKIAVKS